MAKFASSDSWAQAERETAFAKLEHQARLEREQSEMLRRLREEAIKQQQANSARYGGFTQTGTSTGDQWPTQSGSDTTYFATTRYVESGWIPSERIPSPAPPINAIKPIIHKAGHFPIGWMNEAFERAEQSEKMITIQLEKEGVTVVGQEGGSYETHTLSWTMMEKAEVNPILLGIETVEKHLDTLGRLKERVRA